MFKVMKERCDECLYGPNKIVSSARRAQIIKGLSKRDDWFVCHKATLAGCKIACRGDWDQRACGQMGRIAGRLNAVEFVSADIAMTEPTRAQMRRETEPNLGSIEAAPLSEGGE